MPLFYLNDHKGDYPLGHVGREFSDIDAALAEANRVARSLLAGRRRKGHVDLQGRLDIEDETRTPVARIVLSELARQISR